MEIPVLMCLSILVAILIGTIIGTVEYIKKVEQKVKDLEKHIGRELYYAHRRMDHIQNGTED